MYPSLFLPCFRLLLIVSPENGLETLNLIYYLLAVAATKNPNDVLYIHVIQPVQFGIEHMHNWQRKQEAQKLSI